MRPLLLSSMPNNGSDWFSSAIAADPNIKYQREFFTPMINWRYYRQLCAVVGDSLPECCANLTRKASSEEIRELIQSTWSQTGCNFTKECHIAYQMEAFGEHFNCFSLLRPFKNSFPPGRNLIIRLYCQFYWSIVFHGGLQLNQVAPLVASGINSEMRAAIGHFYFAKQLAESSVIMGIPLFDWCKLTLRDPDELQKVSQMTYEGPDWNQVAKRLDETARPIERNEQHMLQWKDALLFHERLVDEYASTSAPAKRIAAYL